MAQRVRGASGYRGLMLIALLTATSPVLSAPVIVGSYQDPDACYAEESLELWVDVQGDQVELSWDASDELWDLGGSMDVFDEDGAFLTCPACPPAQDGDSFVVYLDVTDASGYADATSWEIEIDCGGNSGKVETGCWTSQATGGLLLTLAIVGLRVRRFPVSVQV